MGTGAGQQDGYGPGTTGPPPPAPATGPHRPGDAPKGGGRRLLVVGGLSVVAAVAIVAVATRGGDGGGGEAGTDNWYDEDLEASNALSTDGTTVCASTLWDKVFCADGATGDVHFTHATDSADIPITTGIAGDTLLVADSGGVTAYAVDDGEELWTTSDTVETENELAIAGGVVAVVHSFGPDAELVGIDVGTGDELWRTYVDEDEFAAFDHRAGVHSDGERFYVTQGHLVGEDLGSEIRALDPASGEEVWASPVAGESGYGGIDEMTTLPDGSAAVVVLEGSPGVAVMLDTATGEARWSVPLTPGDPSISGLSAAAAGHVDDVTVIADGAVMKGYDATGQVLWEQPTPSLEGDEDVDEPGTFVAADGVLYLVDHDLLTVAPADGTSRVVVGSVSATDVALAGGRLVVAGSMRLSGLALPLEPLEPPTGG